jgi:hypothetical protein
LLIKELGRLGSSLNTLVSKEFGGLGNQPRVEDLVLAISGIVEVEVVVVWGIDPVLEEESPHHGSEISPGVVELGPETCKELAKHSYYNI